MAGKGIYVLAGAAVALGIAAYMTGDGGKNRVNAMVGEKIVGSFDIEKVDKIEIGDKVTAGTSIALVGNTGSASNPDIGEHLHFELWHDGESVNPMQYINF